MALAAAHGRHNLGWRIGAQEKVHCHPESHPPKLRFSVRGAGHLLGYYNLSEQWEGPVAKNSSHLSLQKLALLLTGMIF